MKVTDSTLPAILLIVVAIGVSGFQIALALGAPLGEWAFGGQHQGVLPPQFRVASVVSLLLYAFQIAHYGSIAGWWLPPISNDTVGVINWIFVAFFSVGTVMNGISRSVKERVAWTPVVAASLVCALWIAL